MPVPDRATLERLVRLRALLMEAQSRASDTTEIGRHNALIQLDGACEYALRLAASHLGLKPEQSFHKTFQNVTGAAPAWVPDGWKGVDELHNERNSVQHRGVLPDVKEVGRWASDAQRFIHSLVPAIFGVQLQDVAVSDAVQSEPIRTKLQAAEAAIDRGDSRSAFNEIWAAFQLARERWASQHRDAVPRRASRPMSTMDLAPPDVREQVEIFSDYHDVAVFAPDMGEYVWLRSIKSTIDHLPIGEDEVRRAYVFVLGWVLRWEGFASRYSISTIRFISHFAQQEPPTTGAGEPHVLEAYLEEGPRDAVAVKIQLADLPAPYTANWIRHFEDVLRQEVKSMEGSPGADVDGAGLVSVYHVSPTEEAVAEIAAAVKRALVAVEEPYQETVREWEDWKQRAPLLTQPYIDALEPLQFEGERLCGEPELEKGGSRGTVALLPLLRANEHGHLRHGFWTEFNSRGLWSVNGPLDLREVGLLDFSTAEFEPEKLAEVIRAVAEAVEEARAAEAAAEAERKQRLEDLATSLEAQLRARQR